MKNESKTATCFYYENVFDQHVVVVVVVVQLIHKYLLLAIICNLFKFNLYTITNQFNSHSTTGSLIPFSIVCVCCRYHCLNNSGGKFRYNFSFICTNLYVYLHRFLLPLLTPVS